jgi:maleate isomerase
VEADYNRMAPHGITFHTGRMYIARPALDSDEAFETLLRDIRAARAIAVRDVVTCKPDYIVMGMSAETFWGGAAGNARFIDEVRAQAGGLGVSTGASACRAGLERLGCKRLAVLSPYQPVADANVTRFFEESGFTVVRFTGLRCPSATAIADVTEHDLVPVLRKLDGDDVDAIVQVGTNLSMVRLADAAERWLGKPVLAINAVTLWHALRANGITDQFPGCGSLLREH